MRRIIAAAALLFLVVGLIAPVVRGSVAYDTFSTNFGYETQAGSNITGASSAPGYTDTANKFISQASGPVSDIWVPVARVSGVNAFDVQLMSDNGNSPGAVLQSWTITDQAFPFDGVYHNPIHLTVAGGTVLQQGTPYWLNLHATSDDGHLVWMFTRPPRFETVAQRFAPGGAWNVLNPGFTSAYRVDVVPEPASAAMGLVLTVLAGRRVRREKNSPSPLPSPSSRERESD